MGILTRKASGILSTENGIALPFAPGDASPKNPEAFIAADGALAGSPVEAAAQLNQHLRDVPAGERLARFRRQVEGKAVFTTSFGLEDQVIHHLIAEQNIDIEIATLDTGRLFRETYELWAETERRYGRRIQAYYPQHAKLESLVKTHGVNGFYDFTRGPRRVLPRPQGRTAQPRACRRRRLDHRPAGGSVEPARDHEAGHGRRARAAQAQPAVRLEPGGGACICRQQQNPDQPAARQRLRFDRLRALHARDCAGRAGARRALVVGN